MTLYCRASLIALLATALGCTTAQRGQPGAGDATPDATAPDASDCFPSCGDEELCGDGDGDGLDNDCDGQVDESCMCPAMDVRRSCFSGTPSQRNVGTCSDGILRCTEFRIWSECMGDQGPVEEVCDGADNDCDGTTDESLSGCDTPLSCPATQGAAPLSEYTLNGRTIYEGPTQSRQWTVFCPPSVPSCPVARDPNAESTSVYFLQSGSYRVRYSFTTMDGEELSCEWVIVVEGAGLRVEMQWDTQGAGAGDTDVDLHLHRRSTEPGSDEPETDFFTDDDCYFANCKATSYTADLRVGWGIGDTDDLDACRQAPHGQGEEWVSRGSCYNPRLDVDVVSCEPSVTEPTNPSFCSAENINIDNPPLGSPVRIMVNYFSDHGYEGETKPTVSIFCGGELRGRFGGDDGPTLTNGAGTGRENDSWLVADVILTRGECGEIQCEIAPLNIVQTGASFGPEWSFD